MRRSQVFGLLALLLVAGLGCSLAQEEEVIDVPEVVEEEKAFLILRKSVVERENLVTGVPFTVEIEIHNAGSSSALEVEVEDSEWPSQQFEHYSGKTTWSSERVKAGATAKYHYEVTPKTSGYIQAVPATGLYKDQPDASTPIVVTSSTPHLFINGSLHKYKALALRVGTYISFGALRTVNQWLNVAVVVGSIAGIVGGKFAYDSVTESQRKSRYQKALEEVNKMK